MVMLADWWSVGFNFMPHKGLFQFLKIFTAKFAKVMFLHLPVSHSVHGAWSVCFSACWDTPPGADTPLEQTTPRADTPWSRHPPEQTPPRTDTPQSRLPSPLCSAVHALNCLWSGYLFGLLNITCSVGSRIFLGGGGSPTLKVGVLTNFFLPKTPWK